jgi:serine/threonine protein kinase
LPQVKVCDFNLSRMVAQQQQLTNSGNPNSPGWQSPEMLAGQPYGKAADVFSFGVVLWEVMTLKEPWRCAVFSFCVPFKIIGAEHVM